MPLFEFLKYTDSGMQFNLIILLRQLAKYLDKLFSSLSTSEFKANSTNDFINKIKAKQIPDII